MAEQSMFSNLYDTATIQNQNADTTAMNVAQLEPGRATVYGAGVAGNMLSGGLNKMLGKQTPQEQKNSLVTNIMQKHANLDPADPNTQLVYKKAFLEVGITDMAMAFDKRYRDMMVKAPVNRTLDQLFTNTVEQSPEYKEAVATRNVKKQREIITKAKKELTLSGDTSNVQVEKFTESSVDENGNTVFTDVWKSYDKKEEKWVKLTSTAQAMKAAQTRTYIKDTEDGTFSITEEWDGTDFIEIGKQNIDDIPNSFEQVAVRSVLNTPGYDKLSKDEQNKLLLDAKASISIPTTESAINNAYRDIQNDYIEQEQALARINNIEDYNSVGTTNGNRRFFEWKNKLAQDVQAAGGNTDISDVLGQYKMWNTVSLNSRNSLDGLQNLRNEINLARGDGDGQNAAAWAVAQRALVALTKDSNLSLAEVQTVSNAGSLPRKITNFLNRAITGVSSDASIQDIEQITLGLERVLIARYNSDHRSVNKSFELAGTSKELLRAMTGEQLEMEVPARLATYAQKLDEAVKRNLFYIKDGKYYDTKNDIEIK